MYSDAFLNDSYLKYVGWTMHDKVSCAPLTLPSIHRYDCLQISFINLISEPGMLVYTLNPSTLEAKAGGSLSLRPA